MLSFIDERRRSDALENNNNKRKHSIERGRKYPLSHSLARSQEKEKERALF